MTEQELTALANKLESARGDYTAALPYPEFALSQGYLTMKAERDALQERLEKAEGESCAEGCRFLGGWAHEIARGEIEPK